MPYFALAAGYGGEKNENNDSCIFRQEYYMGGGSDAGQLGVVGAGMSELP